MRALLLLFLLGLVYTSYSQNAAFYLGYVHETNVEGAWKPADGVQFGVGMENKHLGRFPLTLGVHLSSDLTKSRYSTVYDSIEFDLSDEHSSHWGYANVDYIKRSFALEFDLGYDKYGEAKLAPYISFGPYVENYRSWLNYALYNPDPSFTYNEDPFVLTHTVNFGYVKGFGLKVRPMRWLTIDFRAMCYHSWSQNLEDFSTVPIVSSFHINNNGEPTFDHLSQRDANGWKFRIGLILQMPNQGSGGGGGSSSFPDNGSSSDTIDSGSSGSSGSRGGSKVTLTPKGGRGD